MKTFLSIILFIVILAGCGAAPDSSTKTLVKSGYTDIEITGWLPFSCGDDTFSTGFTATNPQGQPVEGVVCCGILKACVVRF